MPNSNEKNKYNNDTKMALKRFEEVSKILDSHDVGYYIDMSTLLAALPESTFVTDDKKIYISLSNKNDFSKIHTIVSEIRKKGYKVSITTFMNRKNKSENGFFTDPYNIQVITIDKSLKIIFKYTNEEKLNWIVDAREYRVPKKIIDAGFDEIDFHYLKCKIPKAYDEYLSHLYGDWRAYRLPSKKKPNSGKKLKPCTSKDKFDKIFRIGSHEGARFKYNCNKVQALKLLSITISILDKHNVAYYLDFGTLIGAVREKGFIEWDDDVDISLFNEKDYYKIEQVTYEIRKKGLSVMRAPLGVSVDNRKKQAAKDSSIEIHVDEIDFTDKYNTRVLKVTHYNQVEKIINRFLGKFGFKKIAGKCLDIFFKYEKDDQLAWMAQYKMHSIPTNKLSNELIEIDFYNLKCKIPKNYDEYLTSMYGDWKTPKKDWQYYEEDMVTRKQ